MQAYSGGAQPTRGIGSRLTNPAITTRIANTGALASGSWLVGYWLSNFHATNTAYVQLRLRNAADSGNTWFHTVPIPPGQPVIMLVPIKDVTETGEQYDAAMDANFTGDLMASVWCVNVG